MKTDLTTEELQDRRRSSMTTFSAFVGGLFLFSGFAALVYQVVWMRQLSLFFGTDVYAAAITLSVFMGGLSIGGALAERFVNRLAQPLRAYGAIEVAIGVYAFFFQRLLSAFTPMLHEAYRDHFETAPLMYQLLRVGVAVLVLVPPTTLMGMTLPLIVKCFVQRDAELGKFCGYFYMINTLGALGGTIVAAFVLIPKLGVDRTTLLAVGINLIVGALVAGMAGRINIARERRTDVTEPLSGVPAFDRGSARIAHLAIGISGFAALALEVVWTRILTLSFSGTVYSFAIMLASFLFGIAFGSHVGSRRIDQQPNALRYFALIELGLGFSVACLRFATYLVPTLSGTLVWGLTTLSRGNFAFGAITAQLLVGGLLIIIPTMLLGATFPTAVRISASSASQAGSSTASVYAANTGGAILGSLFAGFILIPAVGSGASLIVVSAIFAINGCMLIWYASGRQWQGLREPQFALSLIATAVAMLAVFLPRQTVANYSLQSGYQPEVIYHGEGVAHSVDIVRARNRDVVMTVDGITEADTSFIQRRHFILKGHLPLLLHPAPHDVAVIGLGLGVTLAATERNPEVRSIQLIELTPEMTRAHDYITDVTGGVLRSPKIHLRIDDGRNFLAMSDQQFDMITADPIHPRISGVGYLYTKDYYEALKRRLKPGGVVCQWMPMYNISLRSFNAAFRSFASVFENATFWYVRGHGLFVATQEPMRIDYNMLKERIAAPAVAKDLASIEIPTADDLLGHMLMGPDQIKKYLAAAGDGIINTDDNAYLEYSTPFEFLETTQTIVAALEHYSGFDPALLTNISEPEREELKKAWDARRAKLLPELEEPLR